MTRTARAAALLGAVAGDGCRARATELEQLRTTHDDLRTENAGLTETAAALRREIDTHRTAAQQSRIEAATLREDLAEARATATAG